MPVRAFVCFLHGFSLMSFRIMWKCSLLDSSRSSRLVTFRKLRQRLDLIRSSGVPTVVTVGKLTWLTNCLWYVCAPFDGWGRSVHRRNVCQQLYDKWIMLLLHMKCLTANKTEFPSLNDAHTQPHSCLCTTISSLQVVARTTLSPGGRGLRPSSTSHTPGALHLAMSTRAQVLPGRDSFPAAGHRRNGQHADDRAQRLPNHPRRRRVWGGAFGSLAHGLPAVRSVRHVDDLVRVHYH